MTAASNSEARKRAQEADSASESPLSRPIGPEAGPSQSDWQIDPQAICQCGANGWHICPNAAPVDSGAIGRLNEALAAIVRCGDRYCDTIPGGNEKCADCRDLVTFAINACREHTDRALAEVEQRIEAAMWFTFADEDVDPETEFMRRTEALDIVRAARQEQGR